MARVTVEDCIEKVPNRFELVLMAAKRAKDLERGATPSVQRDNDKSTILALREIADETISLDGLKELAKKEIYEGSDELKSFEDSDEKTLEELMLEGDNFDDIDDIDDENEKFDEEDLKALRDLDSALNDDKEYNDNKESDEEDEVYE